MTQRGPETEATRPTPPASMSAQTLEDANRCIRDLIALSTLPSVWLGANPLRIAESLLAAIDTTVGPKLGFIRIQDAGDSPIEVIHLDGRPIGNDDKLSDTIQAWATAHDPDEVLTIPDGAYRSMRFCVYPLGSDLDAGIVAAGFEQASEPTAFQRTLLNLAANQAVVACQNSALHRKQARLYDQAEKEIAERKRAEAALRESESRFRAAFENAAMGIALVDLEGRFVRVNEAMTAITGYSQEHLTGKKFRDITHPAHAAENEAAARQLIAGELAIYSTEKRYLRKNGSPLWVNLTVSLIRTASGTPQGFITLVEDIDDRKRKEQTLRFLVDLNTAAQQLTNPTEIMALTAEKLGRHLGVDRCAYAEVENEAIFVITGDYMRGVPSIVGRWPVAAFGRDCTRLMLANESYVVSDTDRDPRIGADDLPAYRATNIRAVICVPLHKEQKFVAAMAVHQTQPRQWAREEIELVELVVTRCWESLERARTLRSLRESEQRLRFMAESMPQKIFRAKPTGEIDYVNPQWLEFTGRTFDELRELGWAKLVHPDDADQNVRRWQHSFATGEPFEVEERFRNRHGGYRWHLSRAHPMRDAQGDISMWIGSNTDITEIIEARETLDERREELERLVNERTASLREAIEQMEEFSYSVSHDLRAPLRSMQGYAQVLLTDYAEKIDEEGRGYLRKIATAATRMDRLTLDVLTYSKVARASINPERVSLDQLVPECVDQLAATKVADIDVSRPLHAVLGHQSLLTQVVSNLIGNAVKFARPETRPRILIRTETFDSRVRLWIEDNGIGIEPEHQNRIWGMFERLHASNRYEGTGIGLAIVRKAVERMGGSIGVVSDGRTGSKFWIQLPIGAEQS